MPSNPNGMSAKKAARIIETLADTVVEFTRAAADAAKDSGAEAKAQQVSDAFDYALAAIEVHALTGRSALKSQQRISTGKELKYKAKA